MMPQLITSLRVQNGQVKDVAGLTTWSGTVDIGTNEGIFGDDCICLHRTNTGPSETTRPNKYLYSDRDDLWNFGQSDFTISFYFKIPPDEEFPTVDDVLCNKMPFLNMYTYSVGIWFIGYWYRSSNFDFALGNGSSSWTHDDIDFSVSHSEMASGEWHHIGWTRKSNMLYMFFDGIKKASKDIGNFSPNSSANSAISIGIANGTGAHCNTFIDDFVMIKDCCLWEDSFDLPDTYLCNYIVNKSLLNNIKISD